MGSFPALGEVPPLQAAAGIAAREARVISQPSLVVRRETNRL
jgi:hypothetical protein